MFVRRYGWIGLCLAGCTSLLLATSGCSKKRCKCTADCCKNHVEPVDDDEQDEDDGKDDKDDDDDDRADSYTHTLNAECAYYLDSPAQARPPDGTWPAGTKVTLVKHEGSYAVVRAADGTQAYVSTAALAPKDD
jgi:hypothetical protein